MLPEAPASHRREPEEVHADRDEAAIARERVKVSYRRRLRAPAASTPRSTAIYIRETPRYCQPPWPAGASIAWTVVSHALSMRLLAAHLRRKAAERTFASAGRLAQHGAVRELTSSLCTGGSPRFQRGLGAPERCPRRRRGGWRPTTASSMSRDNHVDQQDAARKPRRTADELPVRVSIGGRRARRRRACAQRLARTPRRPSRASRRT